MIEMNEDFQKEFGAAMAQLRAVVTGLSCSADNARGEARADATAEEPEAAIASYEASHAYWTAFSRVVPVLGSFEDADRLLASLVDGAPKGEELSLAERTYQQRIQYLEEQLGRLDTALRGDTPTLGKRISETDIVEDVIDAAMRRIQDRPERDRAEREHARAQTLAQVTTEVGGLLGVGGLYEIVPKLRRKLHLPEIDLDKAPVGTLLAGRFTGAVGSNQTTYVGRFVEVDPDDGGVIIERICRCGDRDNPRTHIVSCKLKPSTVRLPIAEEIELFTEESKTSGLLLLPEASDE